MGTWKTNSLQEPPLAWVSPLKGDELCFVHQNGHIMGAQHNREKYPDSKDDYNYDGMQVTETPFYNYGMQITGTPYYTIMSYPAAARGFTNWIPRFSSNGVDKDENRIGDEHNDNSTRGGIHQMFPQFFYDYSFYNYSPSQSACTKFFHTRKNCRRIKERFCGPSTGRGGGKYLWKNCR
jgi:hypothetical protein